MAPMTTELESRLWGAAEIPRGQIDSRDRTNDIVSTPFPKRLSDRVAEEVGGAAGAGVSRDVAAVDPDEHELSVPPEARRETIVRESMNLGEALNRARAGIGEALAAAHGLTPLSFAVCGLLAGRAPEGGGRPTEPARAAGGGAEAEFDSELTGAAREIDAVILEHRSLIDGHENLDVRREMRRDIKRLLRGTRRYGEGELDDPVRQVVEVARRRFR